MKLRLDCEMMRLAPAIIILLASCANSKHSEVGEFVYVDCFNTIHVDRECASRLADNPKTKEERMANMQGVQFVDTCNLTRDSWRDVGAMRAAPYQYCPKCVDETAYRHIVAIMDRNEVKPPAR